MCGIVGAIAKNNVVDFLLQGMQRMEYRGYDSAGLATIDDSGAVHRIRRVGKVRELAQAIHQHTKELNGKMGIAHTRWATHGTPSEQNAHPQMAGGRVLVVHNGIIENFGELKQRLEQQGERFESDTDTEVIAKLLYHYLAVDGMGLLQAVYRVTQELSGSYAFAVMDAYHKDQIVVVEWGAPVVLGVSAKGNYLASDPLALLGVTSDLLYLHNHEIARLTSDRIELFDGQLQPIERAVDDAQQLDLEQLSLGDCQHYMLKEILEEPSVAARVVKYGLREATGGGQPDFSLFGEEATQVLPKVKRVCLVACGSSFYAAMLGRYWLESWARLPCRVELASEFRYHPQAIEEDTLLIVISQSGETADTLAALRAADAMGFMSSLAICNVSHSSIMREAKLKWLTRAGAEIGVATTKALLAQLLGLIFLALSFKRLPAERSDKIIDELRRLPALLQETLSLDDGCYELAKQLYQEDRLFYLGRTSCYPVALEGALKLKELSYLHGEGLAAGELKHGVLALIDQGTPVIAMVAHNEVERKAVDNLHEVAARGGKIMAIVDQRVVINQADWTVLRLPELDELSPLLMLVPLQLLAYHVACLCGCDVDQPRNLAKSVTVE